MKAPTLRDVRKLVEKHGGRLVVDPSGWEAIAPDGFRWADAEVVYYPLPLAECESKAELEDMLGVALAMLNGIEPYRP